MFIRNFYHDLYNGISNVFFRSLPGKELQEYFKGLDLLDYIGKAQAFLSNQEEWYRGNPHLDLTPGMTPSIIKTRMNILILGNSNDKMYWWNHINDINQLELKEFIDITGMKYKSYGVKGETIDERWDNLGSPSFIDSKFLEDSAFVKTNCVHTVNVSPGPRLVLSIPLDIDIEKINI